MAGTLLCYYLTTEKIAQSTANLSQNWRNVSDMNLLTVPITFLFVQ
jgi:hypothetical protein